MIRSILAVAVLISLPALASAEVYKCNVGGKTVYADAPCAAGAVSVGSGADRVTEKQRIEAMNVDIRNRKQVMQREADNLTAQAEIVRQNGYAEAEYRRLKGKCDGYLETARVARRDLKVYQHHVGIRSDATDREKEANEKHRKECAGM